METLSVRRWIFGVLMLCIQLLVISITTCLMYKIISARKRLAGANKDTNKRIYRTAISFMTFNWLFNLTVIIAALFNISMALFNDRIMNLTEYTIFNALAAFLLLIQNYLFLIALFTRLYELFSHRGGPLSLHKCTIYLYVEALFLIPILCLSIPITRGLGVRQNVQALTVVIVAFLYLILLSTLLGDFTWKLQQIQKNETLRAFIRRQVVLALLTVGTIMIIFVLTVVRLHSDFGEYESIGDDWTSIIETFLLPSHILLNFLCIAHSYRCCDSLIVMCIGCFRCCCCKLTPITTQDHDALFLEQMILMNSKGRQAHGITPNHGEHHNAPRRRIEHGLTPPPPLQMVGVPPIAGMPPNAGMPPIAGMPTIAGMPPIAGMPAMGHNAAMGQNAPPKTDFTIVYDY